MKKHPDHDKNRKIAQEVADSNKTECITITLDKDHAYIKFQSVELVGEFIYPIKLDQPTEEFYQDFVGTINDLIEDLDLGVL